MHGWGREEVRPGWGRGGGTWSGKRARAPEKLSVFWTTNAMVSSECRHGEVGELPFHNQISACGFV